MDSLVEALQTLGIPTAAATLGGALVTVLLWSIPKLLVMLGLRKSPDESRAADETRMRRNMEADIMRLRYDVAENRKRLAHAEKMHNDCEAQLRGMRRQINRIESNQIG